MALKPCLDCGTLASSTRCVACASTRNKQRGSSSQRSYTYQHQQLRNWMIPLSYGCPCPRCGQPMLQGQPLDLGHSDPALKQAGQPGDRIEHSLCNRRAGGQSNLT